MVCEKLIFIYRDLFFNNNTHAACSKTINIRIKNIALITKNIITNMQVIYTYIVVLYSYNLVKCLINCLYVYDCICT